MVPKGINYSLLVPDDVYAEYGEKAEGKEVEVEEKNKSKMLQTRFEKGE